MLTPKIPQNSNKIDVRNEVAKMMDKSEKRPAPPEPLRPTNRATQGTNRATQGTNRARHWLLVPKHGIGPIWDRHGSIWPDNETIS